VVSNLHLGAGGEADEGSDKSGGELHITIKSVCTVYKNKQYDATSTLPSLVLFCILRSRFVPFLRMFA
jgi:hypothetical protein